MAWTMRLPEEEEAQLNERAATEGRSKQEITRDAVRLYLMRNRTWAEPFLTDEETFDFGGPVTKDDIRRTMRRTA
ncbi:ribbon-helix-helix protein, CopG family [Streptomyces hypolithicus]